MRHFGAPQPASHFEVAEVPEPWTRLEDPAHGGEPHLMDRLDAVATARLHDLAQRCCYGVDRKPLAVELGKLALWLMTMVARRRLDTAAQAELPEAPPLTFLDKNLRSGDSLLGLTWPEARETLQALDIDLGAAAQRRALRTNQHVAEVELRVVFDAHDPASGCRAARGEAGRPHAGEACADS